jgi:hypothetical protein
MNTEAFKAQNSSHWKYFPSVLCFRDVSKNDLCCYSCPRQKVTAYYIGTMWKPGPSLLFPSTGHGELSLRSKGQAGGEQAV